MRFASRAALTGALALTPLLLGAAVFAQSGRGVMHGYVAFQDVAYNDLAKEGVRAKVELRDATRNSRAIYTTETDEHGSYDFKSIVMGEYVLRISAPHYRTYQTEIYLPSDFTCSLATMLRKGKDRGAGKGNR
jgi:protocatechuate 3,4-dioxygenase beta subunit